ncbi:uncharacterized protein MCYG_08580 [Microsporum canis CBS 113480]|uniref:Uncharacterized protein n=1 Tax=Arthroderma otae (strain ATCC MYA-4605 / CBS 113480) TaxID=554155 RepID=C5G0V8_ARTOC|nr:uncharacterized protein MCYG_08580 [Microsporum canis CBS 113480]EEQ35761.1 hypothetical protein MCYG_08580 [Microsporum canis CBS 113480]
MLLSCLLVAMARLAKAKQQILSIVARTMYSCGLYYCPYSIELEWQRRVISALKGIVVATPVSGYGYRLRDEALKFTTSSAAVLLVAVAIALALSVRPDLAWHSIQHLILATAIPVSEEEDGWQMTRFKKRFTTNIVTAWLTRMGYASGSANQWLKDTIVSDFSEIFSNWQLGRWDEDANQVSERNDTTTTMEATGTADTIQLPRGLSVSKKEKNRPISLCRFQSWSVARLESTMYTPACKRLGHGDYYALALSYRVLEQVAVK